MENPVHEEKLNGLTIKIFHDEDPMSPSEEGDDALFLTADHRQFFVKPPKNGPQENVWAHYVKTHHIFPLEAYIHSGVTLALYKEGNFPDRAWDVSQLGAVFVARSEWKKRTAARKAALSLIETYNDYLSGEVYGYKIQDRNGEELESCWGYYGAYDEKDGVLDTARESVRILTHNGITDEKGQFIFGFAKE